MTVRRRLVAGATAWLAVAGVLSGTTAKAEASYSAEIRRTAYGIPHIKADSWGGLGFGHGYAFAEDNLCVLADTFVTVNAERSRHFGPDATYRSEANGVVPTNIESDFFYQRVNDSGVIESLVAGTHPSGSPRPSETVFEIVRGYAAGYNAYLRDVGGAAGVTDPACHGQPWVRPITETDLFRRFYQLSLFASSGALLKYIVAAAPPEPNMSNLPGPSADGRSIDLSGLPSAENLSIGSNAYGLGSEATQSGNGMVLGNPHFPWRGPERFYQVHLTIPGQVNITGIALYGSPLVLIGHNEHLAWSHTVSVPFRFTPYELRLVPGDPTAYVYEGQVRRMAHHDVSVQSKRPDGTLETRTHRFWDTHFGPVIHFPGALMGWTPAAAFSIRDANAFNLRTLDHFVDMQTAATTDEVEQILGRHGAIPWVNTIAADDRGKAFYADMSVVPHITDAQIDTCATAVGRALIQLASLPVLDGSRAACEWGSDPDAAVPGLYGPSALPKLHRSDYVANSNDSFWLSNPEAPLEGYPFVMGSERTARSPRTRLGIRQIQQRLDGTDGRAGTGFTLPQLQNTVFGNRHYVGELVRDDLVAECQEGPVLMKDGTVVDVSDACPVLAAWDVHVDLDSRAAHLVREIMRGSYASTAGFWGDTFDASDPVNTPRKLNRANPDIRWAIGDAVRRFRNKGVALDARLGDVQTARRNDEVIPVHGGSEAGIFNYLLAPLDTATATYPDTTYGASFVMAAELTPEGPRSRTILTYSQSTNRTSPHFADQTRLYSTKTWVETKFTEADVIAATERAYVVSSSAS